MGWSSKLEPLQHGIITLRTWQEPKLHANAFSREISPKYLIDLHHVWSSLKNGWFHDPLSSVFADFSRQETALVIMTTTLHPGLRAQLGSFGHSHCSSHMPEIAGVPYDLGLWKPLVFLNKAGNIKPLFPGGGGMLGGGGRLTRHESSSTSTGRLNCGYITYMVGLYDRYKWRFIAPYQMVQQNMVVTGVKISPRLKWSDTWVTLGPPSRRKSTPFMAGYKLGTQEINRSSTY